MSTRQISFTNTLHKLGSARVGLPIRLQLATPGNAVAQNLESASIKPGAATQVVATTNSSGVYTIGPVDYTGDLTPIGSWYNLWEGDDLVPILGVAYSGSPISVAGLYPTPSVAGTLLMGLKLIDVGAVANADGGLYIAADTRAALPDGRYLTPDSYKFYGANSFGVVTLNMPISSGLTPNTGKYLLKWGDGTVDQFTVPDLPTGHAGAWNSGTTYHVNAGTKISPSDVVSLSGVYYRAVADSLNHTPPNITYWVVLPFEDIGWNLV